MKKLVLIISFAVLANLTANSQISASMQIAKTNSQVALTWSSVVPALYILQSATNLANPIHWNDSLTVWGATGGTNNVTPTEPIKFYRIVQSIPVFELAVFYNLDLEMNPGSAMTINGNVRCNGNIYATGTSSNSPLTFLATVEASQQLNQFSSPLDPRSPARSGNVVFTSSTNNPISNAAPLYLSIGATNNPAKILGLATPEIDPNTSTGQAYIYNQADIIVSNSATTNLSVFYQNWNMVPSHFLIPMDATNIYVSGIILITNPITHLVTSSSAYGTNYYYSFATNVTFYDYRESRTVKAVQIDVAKFSNWLTNTSGGWSYQMMNIIGAFSKSHYINIVYIYNNLANTSTQLPAVRVVNGARLPVSGLTVSTPFPLYVKGDYNTTTNGVNFSTTLGNTANTYPAALMGDAITVLSVNWIDTFNASGATRNTVNTTVNAATLQGIVPSNGTNYSGGLENILRLEENWAGSTLTYNGSFAVLFQSQYATAPWNNSGYYSAPTRLWGFDTNFLIQAKLPPATPFVINQANP